MEDSTLSAQWICHDDNKRKFLEALRRPTGIKEPLFPILVPFLPISSPVETLDWLCMVELENNLPAGSVNSARWVKPVIHRAQNQNCNAQHDTCAICGHEHRTKNCSSYKTLHCVSCEVDDHSSNDQHCPTYEDKCATLNAKHPESSMMYYPTSEPWTQVMLPPKPAPY
ncbi:hypothetical protein PAXRUDRAFT_36870 [Paxillus rubicundulus Ve08.2h10]|uniref:Uncharacterized protein n=1 Tax=Paxillus rubicundulus Ve08.2h10 TaxID=930991 RepID=A0A0D0DG42_9AGAM|nr:hypothetical protein PAXRUDRAFT_36870 [Paxillus rubicundulus Ve08.2h10]